MEKSDLIISSYSAQTTPLIFFVSLMVSFSSFSLEEQDNHF